eukprot:jgi/Mesvir1/17740/Mv05596-RA.1
MAEQFVTSFTDVAADSGQQKKPDVVVPRRFLNAVWVLYFLLLLDIGLNAFTDPLYVLNAAIHVVVICLQLVIIMVLFFSIYLTMTETFFSKKALYLGLFREFPSLFLICPIHFLVFIGIRLYRMALIYSYVPHAQLWDGFYQYAYLIQRLATARG